MTQDWFGAIGCPSIVAKTVNPAVAVDVLTVLETFVSVNSPVTAEKRRSNAVEEELGVWTVVEITVPLGRPLPI